VAAAIADRNRSASSYKAPSCCLSDAFGTARDKDTGRCSCRRGNLALLKLVMTVFWLEDGRTVHIADIQTEGDEFPNTSENARRQGYRTILSVPLMREGVAIGAIVLRRTDARLFSERQIALLQTFADQAVIAIENVRLFDEVQARTRDLSESLQQQTATADVLKIISRSTFDLQVVLNTLVESAARLCKADIAAIHRQQGANYQVVATYGGPADWREVIMRSLPFEAGRGSVLGRTVLERKPVQVPDVLADPDYSAHEVRRSDEQHDPADHGPVRRVPVQGERQAHAAGP
jgi:hypothetical protein